MPYRRSPSPQYNPRLRRVGGTRVKASLAKATAGAYAKPDPQLLKSFRKVMDATRFLATYLSGKKNVTVRPIQNPRAGFSAEQVKVSGRPYFRVNVPDWRYYTLPLDDEKRYTVYKWGLSHEAGGHVRWSPPEVYSHGVDVKDPSKSDALAHHVMNVIEDRRIEDVVKGLANDPAAQPQVEGLKRQGENLRKAARLEMFMQKLIAGAIKNRDQIPKDEVEKVEEVARDVEKMLQDTRKLAYDPSKHDVLYRKYLAPAVDDVIKRLDLRPEQLQQPPEGGEGEPQPTLTRQGRISRM